MWKCIALLLVWEAVGQVLRPRYTSVESPRKLHCMQAPEEAARLAEEAEAFLTAGPEGGFAFWESFQSDWKESGRWVISENEKYKGESSDDSAPRGVCEPCSTTLPCLGSGAVEWAQVPDSKQRARDNRAEQLWPSCRLWTDGQASEPLPARVVEFGTHARPFVALCEGPFGGERQMSLDGFEPQCWEFCVSAMTCHAVVLAVA